MDRVQLRLTQIFFLVLVLCVARGPNAQGLSYDFYDKTCPNVEKIIHNVVSQKLLEAPVAAAGALRIFFHDCFVEGCDASVLIASRESNKAERDAEINLSLPGDGYDVFFRAKRALELQCPGFVSCADVMAIATRDLVNLVGGPRWEVKKGRRDGLISKASRVDGNLPQVNQTIPQLISLFKSKGLSTMDMVALSGGHTIGFSHCKEFMPRIYGYNSTFDIDPTMNQEYARTLRSPCPKKHLDPTVVALNDVTTPFIFDNAYYHNLKKGLGLLASDQMLLLDPLTRGYVDMMAADQQLFFNFFVESMIKLGQVRVKTGSDASSNTVKLERDAEINLSLSGNGFDLFFRATTAVESHCPRVVSCADVVAIVPRDTGSMGPTPSVPLNARSSCTESMATSNLTWTQPWTKTMLKNDAQNDPTALTLDNAYYRNHLQKVFGPKNSGLCEFNGQRSRCVLQSLHHSHDQVGYYKGQDRERGRDHARLWII
ncbi:hypothetical protein NC653_019079 [Populus alba x Populus x berolinensis]|uniref:peroxidase n=1 Tax=Populus alba x Populus x berolinensis TaxID=444605 RepID=A0AAD6VWM1_9ROSI|nr:hypothetical protein NC653_019079 [Populus alba x Populus x berolinensis]